MVVVRAEGTRRIYALDPEALAELDTWLAQFRDLWRQPLDALATELARGQRARRSGPAAPGSVRHASPMTGRPAVSGGASHILARASGPAAEP